MVGKTNAERQAEWRARRRAEIAELRKKAKPEAEGTTADWPPKIGTLLFQQSLRVVKVTKENIHLFVGSREYRSHDNVTVLSLAELQACGAASAGRDNYVYESNTYMLDARGDIAKAVARVKAYRLWKPRRVRSEPKQKLDRILVLRKILQREHPDKGGNVEKFMKAKKELDKLRRKRK